MLELIRHKINEVEITLLETSNKCSRYLLCFEKHYYEVNRNIVDLISVLKRVDHFQEAVSILKKEYGRIYSEEEIELLVIKFIKPILEIDEKTSNPFLFKKEFILHIPVDTRSAFPVISVQSPVSIQCCWQS